MGGYCRLCRDGEDGVVILNGGGAQNHSVLQTELYYSQTTLRVPKLI